MTRWLPAIACVAVLVPTAGCVGDCKIGGSPSGQTLGFMAQYTADVCLEPSGATGLAVAITTPDGNLGLGAAGLRDAAAGEGVEDDTVFRIGPLSELFASALVLRLVDGGQMSLDDLLVSRVPAAVTDAPLAIRHLLSHRSGLKDYTRITGVDLSVPSTPEELLTASLDRGTTADPGARHGLSATNYLAIGLYVEALLGMPWGQALHQELLDPFGLGSTFVDGYDDPPPELAAGHNAAGKDVTSRIDPGNTHAALGVLSTTTDVERLLRLLFEEDGFLSEASRLELRFPAGGAAGEEGFGFGVAIEQLDGEEVWTRAGDHPAGSAGAMLFRPDRSVAVVALQTGTPGRAHWTAELAARFGIRVSEPVEQ